MYMLIYISNNLKFIYAPSPSRLIPVAFIFPTKYWILSKEA